MPLARRPILAHLDRRGMIAWIEDDMEPFRAPCFGPTPGKRSRVAAGHRVRRRPSDHRTPCLKSRSSITSGRSRFTMRSFSRLGETTDITRRSDAVPIMTGLDRRFEIMDMSGPDDRKTLSNASPPFENSPALRRRWPVISTALPVAENGKLRARAIGETSGTISDARDDAGLAHSLRGTRQQFTSGQISPVGREAADVAAIIVAWSAPITLPVRPLAPAFAAGWTCFIKPWPIRNLPARASWNARSCPPGTSTLSTRPGRRGRALVASPDIDGISFTDSRCTGRAIMDAAAPTLNRVGLELGGKTCRLVFDDADLDLATRELTAGALNMAGQLFVAATRFLVREAVAATLRDPTLDAFRCVPTDCGCGSDPGHDAGCRLRRTRELRHDPRRPGL